MSPTHRDASGRLISILQDSNEIDYEQQHTSQKTAPHSQAPAFGPLVMPHSMRSHGSYTSAAPHRESVHSHPSTPDLMRSDSYDSQTSNDPASPITPNTTFQEQLSPRHWAQNTTGLAGSDTFHSASKAQTALRPAYRAEARPILPPISSFASLPSPHTATSPGAAYPYDSMLRHHSSSSLEEHHYRRSYDAREDYPASVLDTPAETMQRDAEQHSDFKHQAPSPLSLEQDHGMDIDEEDESVESTSPGKKGSKGKTCTSPKRYPCKFRETYSCYKTFTTSGHASRHAKIHTAEKTVPCSWPGCNRRFTRSDNMKQHLETHKKDKPRASTRQTRRPSLAAIRRQSSSSRSSVSRFSLPRDTPPLMSPSIGSTMMSPTLSAERWNRPVASRTPSSGLEALAMVAADESRAEQEASYYQQYQQQRTRQQ